MILFTIGIYYRNKIRDLLKQAKEHDIEIKLNNGWLSFVVYPDRGFLEEYSTISRRENFEELCNRAICRASVNINDFIDKK